MSALDAIEMQVFDTASLTASYQAIDADGFEHEVRMLKYYNASDTVITVSYDGATDQDILPNSVEPLVLNLQTNHDAYGPNAAGTYRAQKGQKIYVKGSAGTGNLYVVGYV